MTQCFIDSGFMAEVLPAMLEMTNRLPSLKQRLRVCNVSIFIHLNCFKSGAQSSWNVYKMRNQEFRQERKTGTDELKLRTYKNEMYSCKHTLITRRNKCHLFLCDL